MGKGEKENAKKKEANNKQKKTPHKKKKPNVTTQAVTSTNWGKHCPSKNRGEETKTYRVKPEEKQKKQHETKVGEVQWVDRGRETSDDGADRGCKQKKLIKKKKKVKLRKKREPRKEK